MLSAINKTKLLQRIKKNWPVIFASIFLLFFLCFVIFIRVPFVDENKYGPGEGGVMAFVKKSIAEREDRKIAEEERKEFVARKYEAERKLLAETRKFTVVNFFPNSVVSGSLAIPQDWGRKYEIIESRDVVDFYYLGKATNTRLFSIKVVDPLKWPGEGGEKGEWVILLKEKKVWFLYDLPRIATSNNSLDAKLVSMVRERQLVISSFKVLRTK